MGEARAYYNEIDPYAAQWLRNLIEGGHIAAGDVDERSIADVHPGDLDGYTQCHFFAGIGGWSLALRLAGWPDDRPVWTGSCPCQPYSVASVAHGGAKGQGDHRHLWPVWRPLISEHRPPALFGEQVKAAIGWGWWDEVCRDLEEDAYACAAVVIPASAVEADHERARLYWLADASGQGRQGYQPRPVYLSQRERHSPSLAIRLLSQGAPWEAITPVYALVMGYPLAWNAAQPTATAMPSSRKSRRK